MAWGANNYGQTNVPAPNSDFIGIGAGGYHSLGLKADGSIVAWGCGGFSDFGQCNVPAPNTGLIAVGAGWYHSLGLRTDGTIVAWGCSGPYNYGQCNIPSPNSGFVAVATGRWHSLGIRRVTGDADGDGDMHWADFAAFIDYLLGPSTDPQLTVWQFFDVDMDEDVDLRDLAVWQNAFTGG